MRKRRFGRWLAVGLTLCILAAITAIAVTGGSTKVVNANKRFDVDKMIFWGTSGVSRMYNDASSAEYGTGSGSMDTAQHDWASSTGNSGFLNYGVLTGNYSVSDAGSYARLADWYEGWFPTHDYDLQVWGGQASFKGDGTPQYWDFNYKKTFPFTPVMGAGYNVDSVQNSTDMSVETPNDGRGPYYWTSRVMASDVANDEVQTFTHDANNLGGDDLQKLKDLMRDKPAFADLDKEDPSIGTATAIADMMGGSDKAIVIWAGEDWIVRNKDSSTEGFVGQREGNHPTDMVTYSSAAVLQRYWMGLDVEDNDLDDDGETDYKNFFHHEYDPAPWVNVIDPDGDVMHGYRDDDGIGDDFATGSYQMVHILDASNPESEARKDTDPMLSGHYGMQQVNVLQCSEITRWPDVDICDRLNDTRTWDSDTFREGYSDPEAAMDGDASTEHYVPGGLGYYGNNSDGIDQLPTDNDYVYSRFGEETLKDADGNEIMETKPDGSTGPKYAFTLDDNYYNMQVAGSSYRVTDVHKSQWQQIGNGYHNIFTSGFTYNKRDDGITVDLGSRWKGQQINDNFDNNISPVDYDEDYDEPVRRETDLFPDGWGNSDVNGQSISAYDASTGKYKDGILIDPETGKPSSEYGEGGYLTEEYYGNDMTSNQNDTDKSDGTVSDGNVSTASALRNKASLPEQVGLIFGRVLSGYDYQVEYLVQDDEYESIETAQKMKIVYNSVTFNPCAHQHVVDPETCGDPDCPCPVTNDADGHNSLHCIATCMDHKSPCHNAGSHASYSSAEREIYVSSRCDMDQNTESGYADSWHWHVFGGLGWDGADVSPYDGVGCGGASNCIGYTGNQIGDEANVAKNSGPVSERYVQSEMASSTDHNCRHCIHSGMCHDHILDCPDWVITCDIDEETLPGYCHAREWNAANAAAIHGTRMDGTKDEVAEDPTKYVAWVPASYGCHDDGCEPGHGGDGHVYVKTWYTNPSKPIMKYVAETRHTKGYIEYWHDINPDVQVYVFGLGPYSKSKYDDLKDNIWTDGQDATETGLNEDTNSAGAGSDLGTDSRRITCGLEAHTHASVCYDPTSGALRCGYSQEHTHIDTCYETTGTSGNTEATRTDRVTSNNTGTSGMITQGAKNDPSQNEPFFTEYGRVPLISPLGGGQTTYYHDVGNIDGSVATGVDNIVPQKFFYTNTQERKFVDDGTGVAAAGQEYDYFRRSWLVSENNLVNRWDLSTHNGTVSENEEFIDEIARTDRIDDARQTFNEVLKDNLSNAKFVDIWDLTLDHHPFYRYQSYMNAGQLNNSTDSDAQHGKWFEQSTNDWVFHMVWSTIEQDNLAEGSGAAIDSSMYGVASALTAYANTVISSAGRKDDDHAINDVVASGVAGAGGALGYGDTAYGFRSAVVSPMSSSSSTVDYGALINAEVQGNNTSGSSSAMYQYARYGRLLQDMGIDETGLTSSISERLVPGLFMQGVYIGNSALSTIWQVAVELLDIMNPFRLLVDSNVTVVDVAMGTAMGGTGEVTSGVFGEADGVGDVATGNVTGNAIAGIEEHTTAMKNIAGFFTDLYVRLRGIGLWVVMPVMFAAFIGSTLMFRKRDTWSKGVKLVTTFVFICVGVPLLGVTYTSILHDLDNAMSVASTPASQMIASTFVDFSGWVESSRLDPPTGTTFVSEGSGGGHTNNAGGYASDATINTLRNTAWRINEQTKLIDGMGSNGLTFGSGTRWADFGSGTALGEGETVNLQDVTSTHGASGSFTHTSSNWKQSLASMNSINGLLGRYASGEFYFASDFESETMSRLSSSLSGDQIGNRAGAGGTVDNTGKLYEMFDETSDASKWLARDESENIAIMTGATWGSFNIFGNGALDTDKPADSAVTSATTVTYRHGGPAAVTPTSGLDVGTKTGLSTLSMYNYLNSDFTDSSINIYSAANVANDYQSQAHYSVTSVGSGATGMIFWFNCFIYIFAVVILGFVYALGMVINVTKKGFQMLMALPSAMLGVAKGVVSAISIVVTMILEIIGTIAMYQIVAEFLYAVVTIFDDLAFQAVGNVTATGIAGGILGFVRSVMPEAFYGTSAGYLVGLAGISIATLAGTAVMIRVAPAFLRVADKVSEWFMLSYVLPREAVLAYVARQAGAARRPVRRGFALPVPGFAEIMDGIAYVVSAGFADIKA